MSPEMRRDFEAEWPHLARRLNSFFVRKQVAPDLRDDLVQETGLRLYGIWERVDRTRSPWALTATIALNLIRDQGRRNGHSFSVAEPPEIICTDNVEQTVLARVELRRIRAALAKMTPEQRSILLAEVGLGNGIASTPATKMRRLRARRRLRQVLERALGLVALPVRRLTELGQAFMGIKESFVRVGSCLACMVVGVSSMIALPPEIVAAEPASDYGSVGIRTSVPNATRRFDPVAEMEDDVPIGSHAARTTNAGGRRKSSSSGDDGSSGSPPSGLPLPTGPMPADDVSTTDPPTSDEPVPLPNVPPGGQPGDDPQSVDEAVREVEEQLDEVLNG